MGHMRPMLYLFHGEDDFLSSQKLSEWKNIFVSKHGDFNLSYFDESNFDFGEMINSIKASPFLGEKRLIVLDGLLGAWKKEDKEKFEKVIGEIPETTIVLFYENEKLDSRNSLLKHFRKENIKNHQAMDELKLNAWMAVKFQETGYIVEPQALKALTTMTGSNTRQIYNEIGKLMAYRFEEKKITADDVRELTIAHENTNIFDFTGALARKDLKTAQKILKNIFDSGKETYIILSLIAGQFRNLLALKIAREEKISSDEVAEKLKIHPYPLKLAGQQLHHFTMERLKEIYSLIAATDLAIKTGEMEERLALDLLVVKICGH